MDRVIALYPAQDAGALRMCVENGVAYQSNMRYRQEVYNDAYYAKVGSYAPAIEAAVLRGRVGLISVVLPPRASVVDWGAGSGSFVRAARVAGFSCQGFDVMPSAVLALQRDHLYTKRIDAATDGLTLWDTIEHLENPAYPMCSLRRGAAVFLSLPIFERLDDIPFSKHYRPGEHLYYFTREGLEAWMKAHGFLLVRESDHETRAGRQGIGSFAFIRV